MSKAAAQSKWESMKASIEEDGTVTDNDGHRHAPLRIRIKTSDLVNFKNTYTRSKRLACFYWCFGSGFSSAGLLSLSGGWALCQLLRVVRL